MVQKMVKTVQGLRCEPFFKRPAQGPRKRECSMSAYGESDGGDQHPQKRAIKGPHKKPGSLPWNGGRDNPAVPAEESARQNPMGQETQELQFFLARKRRIRRVLSIFDRSPGFDTSPLFRSRHGQETTVHIVTASVAMNDVPRTRSGESPRRRHAVPGYRTGA